MQCFIAAILPGLNDGPWRDDAHRTEVMRPYLRKVLTLDPARDEQRVYVIIDHVYRSALPDICDALKLDKHGSALRDLAPIVDRQTSLGYECLKENEHSIRLLDHWRIVFELDENRSPPVMIVVAIDEYRKIFRRV